MRLESLPEYPKKIVCAMSGGVDSSVCAALLKRAGFNVIGVFMKFWLGPGENGLIGAWNRCCSLEAETRARKVANILDIPFYVFNFEKEFKKRIVDYFLEGYKRGITPNPCVVCNKEIKFGLLLEKALELDANFVATGHYAKTNLSDFVFSKNRLQIQTIASNWRRFKVRLFRGKDKNKDQSYFLWMLNQNQLKRILFPIGDYTRSEVEKLAKKFKLDFLLNIPKSVEICFIQTTVNDFLKRYLKPKPGPICLKSNPKQKIIAKHQGLAFYTIGQRKGIGLPAGPYYVLDKDLKKNILLVTKNENDLYKTELIANNVNWISGQEPKLPILVEAKIRYRQLPAPAILSRPTNSEVYRLKFKTPQRAITPGQSVVFYRRDQLLGGGIIG